VLSVASIGVEVIPGLPDWARRALRIEEIVVVAVFSLEYVRSSTRKGIWQAHAPRAVEGKPHRPPKSEEAQIDTSQAQAWQFRKDVNVCSVSGEMSACLSA